MLAPPFHRKALRFANLGGRHQRLSIFDILRRLAVRCGCKTEPHIGKDQVYLNAVTFGVNEAEIVLGRGMALIGRKSIPLRSRCMIMAHVFVMKPEI